MAHFVIVRHGETIWNLQHRQQGHKDSPLTDLGLKQAQALAHVLRKEKFNAVYSSDLGRAFQTAQTIAGELNIDVNLDAELRERNLGIMEGLTLEELHARHPEAHHGWISADPAWRIPGGESENELHARSISAFHRIAERHPNARILIVTHSGTLKSLLLHTLGLSAGAPRTFSLFNASINLFRYREGRWYLETWGNITHLEGLGSIDYR